MYSCLRCFFVNEDFVNKGTFILQREYLIGMCCLSGSLSSFLIILINQCFGVQKYTASDQSTGTSRILSPYFCTVWLCTKQAGMFYRNCD